MIGVESTAWDHWLFASYSLYFSLKFTRLSLSLLFPDLLSSALVLAQWSIHTGETKMSSATAWPAAGVHGEHPSHLKDPPLMPVSQQHLTVCTMGLTEVQ